MDRAGSPRPVPTGTLPVIDVGILLAVVGLLATVAWLGHDVWHRLPPEGLATIDMSPSCLPYYAVRSLVRMVAALGASLAFTLLIGTWAARSQRAARIILPALDVLQSVPVLGFLSATVTFFMAVAPGRVLGLELASIFAVFTGQVWNLTFAFYHSLITLPSDQAEAVRLYRLSAWRRFTHFEVPAAIIPLVWNGMMSFGGGWFFLAASEAITVLNRELLLPGVGSYMAVAVKAQNLRALGWALLTMAVMIVLVDWAFWRPLVAWAERFKLEESRAAGIPRSSVLDLLHRSRIVPWLGTCLARGDDALDRVWRRWQRPAARPPDPARERLMDRIFTLAIWWTLGGLAVWGAVFFTSEVPAVEGLRVMALGALTLTRVALVVALSAVAWTPVGVWIGLNPGPARRAQPVVQVLAAFPANFLFPVVTILFLRHQWSLEWGAACLMALGAQWYLLFNTIAGAMAIPNDLREMTADFGLHGWLRWRSLFLPAIFPAWVTGALAAAGGAWNASIVAEVVTWGETRLTASGLGAYITQATTAGDWPRIVLGVAVMSAYVVTLDRLLWRPLQRLAEGRYRLG
jgi:NitT/TauT family transport system permease protein